MQVFIDRNVSMQEFVEYYGPAERAAFLKNKVQVYKTPNQNGDVTTGSIYDWLFKNTAGRFVLNLFVFQIAPENWETASEEDRQRVGEISGCIYFEAATEATKFANEMTRLYP